RQLENLETAAAPVAFGRQEAVDAAADVTEARGADGERDEQQGGGRTQPASGDARSGERGERHGEHHGGGGKIGLGDQHEDRHQRQQQRERRGFEPVDRAAIGGGSAADPGRNQQA